MALRLPLPVQMLLEDLENAASNNSSKIKEQLEDILAGIIFAFHTTAFVTLPEKFAGGPVAGLGFVWVVGAFLCIAFAAMSPLRTLKAALLGWPVLLLTLWLWLTYTWSVAPGDTLRGLVYITCCHIFVFAIAGRFSWERIVSVSTWAITFFLALSVFLVIFVPSIGKMSEVHPGAWAGVWPDKQLFGMFACHGLIGSLCIIFQRRGISWWWLGIVISIAAILGSTGKTAILMALASIMIGIWFVFIQKSAFSAVLSSWLGLVLALSAVAICLLATNEILDMLGRSSDLTGRTQIWEIVKEIGDKRPLTGWGYQAIWRGDREMTSPFQWVFERIDFKPANAHSSWWDAYIQLGIPGLLLVALCLIWSWLGIFLRAGAANIGGIFASATLAALTFISFTETNFLNFMDLQWMLVPLIGTKMFVDWFDSLKPTNGRVDDIDGVLDGEVFTFR